MDDGDEGVVSTDDSAMQHAVALSESTDDGDEVEVSTDLR
jgi:hypothetical protein